ncbi:MAG TPA: TraB/GumN family protein [Vicinamibacterales bacterium]|nr:TraB/GumN family protein [Vicinamibacterales bacterium]
MKRRAFVAALLLVACLAPARGAGHPFAWKATGKQGVVYLVGSVHLLSKDFYPLNPALDAAYKDSNLLVEEVDLGEMAQPESQFGLLSKGMLPGNQTLDTVLSPATLALLNKHLPDLGPMADAMKKFKPWMAALTIESLEWVKDGFDPNLGLDKHFYDRAIADKKTVQGFETMAFQIGLFDDMPMDQQDKLLASMLKDVDTEKANMSKLIAAWRDGDAATVERIVLSDLKSDPAIYKRMLVDRNRNWMPKIEQLFPRSGHTLVVVGAAHLVGPDGLLAQLRAKGYTIEQL